MGVIAAQSRPFVTYDDRLARERVLSEKLAYAVCIEVVHLRRHRQTSFLGSPVERPLVAPVRRVVTNAPADADAHVSRSTTDWA
jgi:hypothetical protein